MKLKKEIHSIFLLYKNQVLEIKFLENKYLTYSKYFQLTICFLNMIFNYHEMYYYTETSIYI